MKYLPLMIICCLQVMLFGCSSNQYSKKESRDLLNCGPVALATYSRITSKTDKDVAAKALKIYEIIGKKEGSAVSMLDLKEAALACGFEVEPRILTSDKLENLESYAIVYMPQSQPTVSKQSDPAGIGHFVSGAVFQYADVDSQPLNFGGSPS